MKKRTVIAILLMSYFLYGCSSVEEKESMQESFVGQTTESLVKALGEPKYWIDTTFDDERESVTLVYASTNPSLNCVESYKIDRRSQTIIDYACR
ncbi:hypothetical protein ACFL3U_01020 [Pseudomonadota bacterium]